MRRLCVWVCVCVCVCVCVLPGELKDKTAAGCAEVASVPCAFWVNSFWVGLVAWLSYRVRV